MYYSKKKSVLRIALTLICSISIITLIAQPKLEEIFPPSPTASEFVKQLNFPANYYTGTPEISIPIWNLESKTLSVPISLSYHASGIKVEQTAGWTGLGWTLFAGGQITREVRGKPDDFVNIGYMNNMRNIGPLVIDWFNNNLNDDAKYIAVSTNQFDLEPDIFSYSFPGGSGKFVYDYNYLDEDKKYVTFPHEFIKIKSISKSNSLLAEWEITDKNGIIYSFINYDHNLCGTNNDLNNISTWYLNKIKDPINNDSILFTYESVEERMDVQHSSTDYICTTGGCSLDDMDFSQSATYINIHGYKLKSIKTDLTEINFTNTIERVDYRDAKGSLLQRITIQDRKTGTEKVIFDFDYETVVSSNFIGTIIYPNSDYLKKRAFLNSITKSASGVEPYVYSFEYYSKTELPPRNSFAQDEWGYYNQKDNHTLIPSQVLYNGPTQYIYPGADKTPRLVSALAGTLKKIIWPTGGYTTYNFELHNYGYIRNLQINEDGGEGGTNPITEHYLAEGTAGSFTAPKLTIEKDQFVTIDVEIPYIQVGLWFKITNIGSPSEVEAVDRDKQIFLKAGEYRIETVQGGILTTEDEDKAVSIRITYTRYEAIIVSGSSLICKVAGGLRVRSISNYDNIKKATLTKYFEYTMLPDYRIDPEDKIRSSGVLVNDPPNYKTSYNTLEKEIDKSSPIECAYTLLHSKSVSSIGLSAGSHVVYRQVCVYDEKTSGKIIDPQNPPVISYLNGKSIYCYNTPYEYPDPQAILFLPIPSGKNEWKRGMLKSTSVFDSDNRLLKFENNNYAESQTYYKNVRGHKIIFEREKIGELLNSVNIYNPVSYDMTTGWKYLQSTDTYEYFYNESGVASQLHTITSYNYNNSTTMLNTKTTNVEESGKLADIVTENYKYGYQDEVMGSQFIDKFFYNAKTEITKSLNTIVFDGTQINYNNDLLPQSVEKLRNEVYELEASYKYNDDKRIIEFQKAEDIPVSIIWGYKSLFPVAKITGLDYTNAISAFTSSELTAIKENTLSDSELLALLTKLYNPALINHKNALINTYIYHALFGIKTMIDQNAKRTYYNRDGFGRLIDVKDNLGNLLQTYEYHFNN